MKSELLLKSIQAIGIVSTKGQKTLVGMNANGAILLRRFSVGRKQNHKFKPFTPKIITPQLSDGLLEILHGHGIEKVLATSDSFMPSASFPLPLDIREKIVADSREHIKKSDPALLEILENFSPQKGGGDKIIYLQFPKLPTPTKMPVLYVSGFEQASKKRKVAIISNAYYQICYTDIVMGIAGFEQKPRGYINSYLLHTSRNPTQEEREKNYDGTYHTDEPKPPQKMPDATLLLCAKGNGTSTYILKAEEIIAKIDPKYLEILSKKFYFEDDSYDHFQIYDPVKKELLIDTNIALAEIKSFEVKPEILREAMYAALMAVVETVAYKVTLKENELLGFARQIHARGEEIIYTPPLYTSLGISPFLIDPSKEESQNIFRTLIASSYRYKKPQSNPENQSARSIVEKQIKEYELL